MTLLSRSSSSSVGNILNPNQFDSHSIFIVLRPKGVDSQTEATGADEVVYNLIPEDGNGQERLLQPANTIMEVRSCPADWVYHLDNEEGKLEMVALVKGATTFTCDELLGEWG
ncbi:uncharacterized protein Z518_00812 [Rhinocladiella mackenziei CBS 650.93]|uniref:Uncharacterized protein n=1 Tax=Rhinocladiella mackenziei CBS 650.93 TaxID=1442369 RepID=A0A0D2J201_9EURO|nr:uncharacterized protein Z518_00812 [Rhinocladiella mackenziei CBS 650.93]KIX09731.1 hypothetical protein Z518_00812 [Rhinocladiella mackenziei CBS 650.93]